MNKLEPTYTLEDLPYCREHDNHTVYVFGLHTGEPTDREIYHRKIYRHNNGRNPLAISLPCPCCNGTNTEWIRESSGSWSICYSCEIAFDQSEYIDLSECE
jgi:hypothetical protein